MKRIVGMVSVSGLVEITVRDQGAKNLVLENFTASDLWTHDCDEGRQ